METIGNSGWSASLKDLNLIRATWGMPTIFRRGLALERSYLGQSVPAFAASRLENEKGKGAVVKAGYFNAQVRQVFSVYQRWLGEMRLLDAGSGSEGDERCKPLQ